jgi:hypothetical protein
MEQMKAEHGPIYDGSVSRDVIMTNLMNQGWVRIRKVDSKQMGSYWTIQLSTQGSSRLPRTVKNNVINWAMAMMATNDNFKRQNVMVLNEKGERLFGGNTPSTWKTIENIVLDDTGVFESVVSPARGMGVWASHKASTKNWREFLEEKLDYPQQDDGTVRLTETTLTKMLTTHNDAGYIIISAWRSENNHDENNIKNNELKNDISKSGYSHFPVWGGFVETDRETGEEHEVKEKSYVITNFPKGKTEPNADSEGLKALGLQLADKYEQESFLYKPKGNDKKAYYIKPDGEVDFSFDSVSPTQSADVYFTNLKKSIKKDKNGKSFTFENVLYMAKSPQSTSQAYKRYGEHFFNI